MGGRDALSGVERRCLYSRDATGWTGAPDVVVRPRDTEEVARVLRLAREASVPVTPRGGGTGLAGGAVPARGGIVLSSERMNGAPRISAEDLYVEVAPGVVTAELHRIVESHGLFFPPDPTSAATCTVGGNIAEGAGGPRDFKYGSFRRYVLGLEVVTPEGDVLETGGRTVKNVAGYGLARLWVGSEGVLGFITSAVLGLLPLPRARKTLSARFGDLGAALEAGGRLAADDLAPSAVEVMDALCTRVVAEHLGRGVGDGVLLLAEFDGMASVAGGIAERAAGLLEAEFKVDARIDGEPAAREDLWLARRAVLPALTRLGPAALVENITVPRGGLPAMAAEIGKIAARHDVRIAVFGHVGGGNLHPTMLADCSDTDEMARVKAAASELRRACVDLGGTVSNPRCVGVDERPFPKLDAGRTGCEIMKSLREWLDPAGIMNPGKMFQDD